MAGKKYATTDPEAIRQWAEARHGTPVLFHEGGSESQERWPGFAFPDYHHANTYEEITWQKLLQKCDEADLVFLYQETTETGEISLYNRFVSQQVADEAVATDAEPHDPSSDASGFGPTESHQTPLAQGKQAFRDHAGDRAFSNVKMVGLIIISVLVVMLIVVAFWPASP